MNYSKLIFVLVISGITSTTQLLGQVTSNQGIDTLDIPYEEGMFDGLDLKGKTLPDSGYLVFPYDVDVDFTLALLNRGKLSPEYTVDPSKFEKSWKIQTCSSDCELPVVRKLIKFVHNPENDNKIVQEVVTLVYLPHNWTEYKNEVKVVHQPPDIYIPGEKPSLFNFYAEYQLSADFKHNHALNKPWIHKYGAGVRNDPWVTKFFGLKFLEFRAGVYYFPSIDFDWYVPAPEIDGNPEPDEGWCNCSSGKIQPMVSLYLQLARRVPMGSFWGGEWGIKPYASLDAKITKAPIPDTESYSLPGTIIIGTDLYYQIKLRDSKKQATGATFIVATGPKWQFAKYADTGLEWDLIRAGLVYSLPIYAKTKL